HLTRTGVAIALAVVHRLGQGLLVDVLAYAVPVAELIDAHARRDGEHPRPDRRCVAIPFACPMQLHERRLRQVVGHVFVLERAQKDPVDGGGETREQTNERLPVAGDVCGHQGLICHSIRHWIRPSARPGYATSTGTAHAAPFPRVYLAACIPGRRARRPPTNPRRKPPPDLAHFATRRQTRRTRAAAPRGRPGHVAYSPRDAPPRRPGWCIPPP